MSTPPNDDVIPPVDPSAITWDLDEMAHSMLAPEVRDYIRLIAHDEERWLLFLRRTRREKWHDVRRTLARYWRGVCLTQRLRADIRRDDERRLEDAP